MEGKKLHNKLQARAKTLLSNIRDFMQACIDGNDTDALYRFSRHLDDILAEDACL